MGASRLQRSVVGVIAAALLGGVAITGCGGDEGDDSGDTAQDEAALEELVLNYAASDTPREACALYSEDLLATPDGNCERIEYEAITVTVDEITVDGDTAEILVTVVPDGDQFRYPAVREGSPTDAYDGWLIDEVAYDATLVQADEEAEEEDDAETEEQTTTTAEPPGAKDLQAAYRSCVEGRGAPEVAQDNSGKPPQVEFSGDKGPVFAWFPANDADLQKDISDISQAAAYVEQFGTMIVWSLFKPAAADLELATACAEEVT